MRVCSCFRILSTVWIVAMTKVTANKRFIIRLDDIQDSYLSTIQVQLLQFFMTRNISVAAGIIGDFFSGTDAPLSQTLQRCVELGPEKCQLFNRGTNAIFRFGDSSSVAEQKAYIQSCDIKVKSLFNGYQMELFAPYANSWNDKTLVALQESGYQAISASIQSYSNMTWDLQKSPFQMPQQAATGDYLPSSKTWIAVPLSTTIDNCNAAAARGEVCVINVHPHEFGNGAYTFKMLETLLDTLTVTEGFTSTSFHTVMKEATARPTALPTVTPSVTSIDTYRPSIIILVGIICGGVLFLTLIGVGIQYYYVREMKTKKKTSSNDTSDTGRSQSDVSTHRRSRRDQSVIDPFAETKLGLELEV